VVKELEQLAAATAPIPDQLRHRANCG